MIKTKVTKQVTKTISTLETWAKLLRLGRWAFFVGVLVAILAGFTTIPYLATILVVAGLLVGFLNIPTDETRVFLVAAIALLLVGTAGLEVFTAVGTYIESILKNIVTFVAPAALVVALKTILNLAKE